MAKGDKNAPTANADESGAESARSNAAQAGRKPADFAQALHGHARSYEDGQIELQRDAAKARLQCGERAAQAQRQLGRELSDLQRRLAEALNGGDSIKDAQTRAADACKKLHEASQALAEEWQREREEAEKQLTEAWRQAQAEPDAAQRAATLQRQYADRLHAVAGSGSAQQVQQAQDEAVRCTRELAESGQQIAVDAWRAYQDGVRDALSRCAAECDAAQREWLQQGERLQRRALAQQRQLAMDTLREWQAAWESLAIETADAA